MSAWHSNHPRASVDSSYSWLRLAAAVVLTTVGCAGMYISMVGVPAYQAEFGVTRGGAALPFTFLMLGFGVGSIVIGRLVDRYGIVMPLAVATSLLAGSFFVAAGTDSYLGFLGLHAFLGAFGCAAVFSPLLVDISKWFLRWRGFAIAVCASGNYLAGTVWPPIIASMIEREGWRATYEWFGLVSVLIMLPILWLLRRKPPVGESVAPDGGSAGSPMTLGISPFMLMLLLSVAGIGCCTAMAMPQAHILALTVDLGFAARHGAEMLSLMFGCGVVSRLAFGWLSDRIGGLRTLLASSTLQCVSLAIFLPANNISTLYVASALFGLFQGGIVPCYALIVREYFPESEAGARTGVIIFATLIGMAFGAWIAGALFDWTSSYRLSLFNSIGWNLVNIAIIGFLLLKAKQNHAVTVF